MAITRFKAILDGKYRGKFAIDRGTDLNIQGQLLDSFTNKKIALGANAPVLRLMNPGVSPSETPLETVTSTIANATEGTFSIDWIGNKTDHGPGLFDAYITWENGSSETFVDGPTKIQFK